MIETSKTGKIWKGPIMQEILKREGHIKRGRFTGINTVYMYIIQFSITFFCFHSFACSLHPHSLSFMKHAIIKNNRAEIEQLYWTVHNHLPVVYKTPVYFNRDIIGESLIPADYCDSENVHAARCSPDGSCLFNALSIAIKGKLSFL